jgi:hypothetical protein
MKVLVTAAMISFCLIVALIFGVLPARANPISDLNETQAIYDLKQHLVKEYPDKFTVQSSLLKVGKKSHKWLLTIPDGEPHDGILKRLIEDYYPNFSAIKTLYRAEIKAWAEMNTGD